MADAFDTPALIYQNLKDAGCDIQTTENCMSFVKAGNLKGMLPILQQYRKALLGTVRTGQKKIDCLDYLIYKIQKEMNGGL
ncbi:hypothetical protein [Clostridium sp. Marseille-P3244]|uniref:hypothetical protein n=1 Tax=Clostridium sp. Marseille-P3244 TaxID=1871020 RepID=UPI0009315B37|nr:hypothetical protein [Clostridium sp. Marseille-P3244]